VSCTCTFNMYTYKDTYKDTRTCIFCSDDQAFRAFYAPQAPRRLYVSANTHTHTHTQPHTHTHTQCSGDQGCQVPDAPERLCPKSPHRRSSLSLSLSGSLSGSLSPSLPPLSLGLTLSLSGSLCLSFASSCANAYHQFQACMAAVAAVMAKAAILIDRLRLSRGVGGREKGNGEWEIGRGGACGAGAGAGGGGGGGTLIQS